jgi:hypothetical protein
MKFVAIIIIAVIAVVASLTIVDATPVLHRRAPQPTYGLEPLKYYHQYLKEEYPLKYLITLTKEEYKRLAVLQALLELETRQKLEKYHRELKERYQRHHREEERRCLKALKKALRQTLCLVYPRQDIK